MKKTILSFLAVWLCCAISAQSIGARLQAAFTRFEGDSQLSNALSSLYVVDAATGRTVFARNERVGMATASTLKVITAATAYELLGRDFRYSTSFEQAGNREGSVLHGALSIHPSGDPTLGSWRWPSTTDRAVLDRVVKAIKTLGIRQYDSIIVYEEGWGGTPVPDGWIWQDIGNYYGAGAQVLNWRENQYDLTFRPNAILGRPAQLVKVTPHLYFTDIHPQVTTAGAGTGDQTYIYLPIGSSTAEVYGTIPTDKESFVISGALPSGRDQFIATLIDTLTATGIRKTGPGLTASSSHNFYFSSGAIFHQEQSPPLDSIVYWFLKKSINLYGEALLKTVSLREMQRSDKGPELLRTFWKSRGIAPTELAVVDGSGLSPLDRVTTHAQVTVLQYARRRPWFDGYYNAFPEYNGMKMKSGTISGVKGFCGYQHSGDGHDYIFAFLVNNYNGSSAQLVQKMYTVLNELKGK